jgi:hypothetical protein
MNDLATDRGAPVLGGSTGMGLDAAAWASGLLVACDGEEHLG